MFNWFWSINLDVRWEDRWKPPVVLIGDPKHLSFSSVFSLGINTHARDEFRHFFIGYQTYELLKTLQVFFDSPSRATALNLLFLWLSSVLGILLVHARFNFWHFCIGVNKGKTVEKIIWLIFRVKFDRTKNLKFRSNFSFPPAIYGLKKKPSAGKWDDSQKR